jgi:chromosomal replication initiation ATPase DnaA
LLGRLDVRLVEHAVGLLTAALDGPAERTPDSPLESPPEPPSDSSADPHGVDPRRVDAGPVGRTRHAVVAAAFLPRSAAYNPLVIVGPPGAGKSRLVGDLFIRRCRREEAGSAAAPCLWDGRSLGRDLTAALSSDTLHRLHARFDGAGLVIIDGVEQISAWDTQRCLALLLDVATAAGTAVVVTLRMHPIACPGLEPSLASRLSGGLVVSLPAPAVVPGAGRGPRAEGDPPPPSLRRILGVAARRHGLAVADLTGPSRRRSVTEARGEAMYIARALTGRSLEALGGVFGGRDHTTVLHGIRVTERRRARNPVLAAEIDRTIESLRRPVRRRRGTARPRS